MRVMVIVKASQESEPGALPSAELLAAMGEYNNQLIAAGVMLDGAGLQASAKGARVSLRQGQATVTDGPFAETKEVIGGFALFELPDMAAAIESAREFMALHVEHMPGWEGVCEVRGVAGSQVELIKGGQS